MEVDPVGAKTGALVVVQVGGDDAAVVVQDVGFVDFGETGREGGEDVQVLEAGVGAGRAIEDRHDIVELGVGEVADWVGLVGGSGGEESEERDERGGACGRKHCVVWW